MSVRLKNKHNKLKKILSIFIGLMIFLIIGFSLLFTALILQEVKKDYYKKVDAVGTLENKYTYHGEYKVSSYEVDSHEDLFGKYKIWFPSKLEKDEIGKYPVVIFVNGTGLPYRKYEPIFEHLASWGFVAVGNDDPSSGNGKSTSITLDYITSLNNTKGNIFYNKLDMKNIGVRGYSQGGPGAINAVTEFENSHKFTSMYTISTTSYSIINYWHLKRWYYDTSKINIPYFMVSSTGIIDSHILSLPSSLFNNYNNINDKIPSIMARRKNVDHVGVVTHADNYMTAWFRYTLMQDKEARNVFCGDSPEILNNSTNWKDVKMRNLEYIN